MHRGLRALILAAVMLVAGLADPRAQDAIKPATMPTPPLAAAPPDDGQWTMPAKNYASTRYSELSEINTETAKNLQVAFTFSTGVNRGQESSPLVVGDTMYVLYALDLTKPGAPQKWQYNPKPLVPRSC